MMFGGDFFSLPSLDLISCIRLPVSDLSSVSVVINLETKGLDIF